MAAPTIPNGEEHFFVTKYEGNGAGQRVGRFVPFDDSSGGTIANSCIFNDGDSAQLERTPSSNGNRRTFTVSAWVKRGVLGTEQHICSSYDGSSSDNNSMWEFRFLAANTISISRYTDNILITNRTFEDTSKFYHLLMAVDTTQGTASNRVKLYVDGDEVTSFGTDVRSAVAQDFDTAFNNTADACVVGNRKGDSKYFDGYMAEVNLVDGTALDPSTFGVTDTSTGRWIPKALTGITYGTNGFRLQFGSSSALGDDTSGNNNDFSVSNLVAGDQTTDSPTQNHATIDINTASNSSMTFAEGNLNVEMNNAYPGNVLGTLGASSGKYYWEVTISGTGSSANGYATGVGVAEWSKLNSDAGSTSSPFSSFIDSRSLFFHNGSSVSNSTSFTAGDVISIALNLDDSEISYFKNNTIVGSAQPLVEGQTYFPLFKNSTSVADLRYTPNFGQKSWNYTPPTGFVALQQDNLPETAKGITGVAWMKDRDTVRNHVLFDSSRGAGKALLPSATNAEIVSEDTLYKFLKGGFAYGEDTTGNTAGKSYVSWNWVANGGTRETNTNGSLTSTVQANTTAGFSIVEFTGTAAAATVGHGLSSAPEWIVCKNLEDTASWAVYHKDMSSAAYTLFLNTTAAQTSTSTMWNSTAPTSSVINVGANYASNGSSQKMVHYCWHSVDGFSKFGKYVGNGSTDGVYVATNFSPSFIIVRPTAGGSWIMLDKARNPTNPINRTVWANLTSAESTSYTWMDFLSNGFKLRDASNGLNNSGATYIYMAFAEHPFVGDGTNPVTAR